MLLFVLLRSQQVFRLGAFQEEDALGRGGCAEKKV